MKKQWKQIKGMPNVILDNEKGIVYISYNPNDPKGYIFSSDLDSANPETAIVLIGDKLMDGKKRNRFLIFRGDHREQLEKIYPNVEKLKAYWRKHGGHFWSDGLDD